MTITADIHNATEMTAGQGGRDAWFDIEGRSGYFTVFCPPHVAAATSAAFNRAMQVKPRGDALVYATDAGLWHISTDDARGTVWLAQHDDITGDNDPAWMTASAHSLEALQDAIDDIQAEHCCAECKRMFGRDALTESNREIVCFDCAERRAYDAACQAEAAGDDKAHAHAERMAEDAA